MPIFFYVLIAVGVLIGLFIIIVARRPAEFRIERTKLISASPATVFEEVNDLHKWAAWSPWEKLDPQMRKSYEGPPAGVGAVYKWEGNKKVGQGVMTITASVPGSRVTIRLQFIKPFAATNTTEFHFEPHEGQTKVTWSMAGRNNFMAKMFTMFMNMDKMIGGDFEKGLEGLRKVAEDGAA